MSQFKPNEIIQAHLEKVQEIGKFLFDKGWAERNGGNISINLTGLQEIEPKIIKHARHIARPCPREAAGMLLFVTGTGERMRDLVKRIDQVSCIITIDDQAAGYHIIWGGEGREQFRPTSEFLSHLELHLQNRVMRPEVRCLLHAHPIELLAASYHPLFAEDSRGFTKMLWSMLPEVRLFVPRGTALLPYAMPGSERLAELTAEGLKKYDVVVWRKHGALAAGVDATDSFDLIDVANKGAAVFLSCAHAGFIPDGLSDEELDELEQEYLQKEEKR